MAGYWPSIKNKAQKGDVTFFRPLSLPGSLLQKSFNSAASEVLL